MTIIRDASAGLVYEVNMYSCDVCAHEVSSYTNRWMYQHCHLQGSCCYNLLATNRLYMVQTETSQ